MNNGFVVDIDSIDPTRPWDPTRLSEFTEFAVRDGTIALRARHERSVYQIDTPFASIDASGPARCRVDTDNGVQVGVRSGSRTVTRVG